MIKRILKKIQTIKAMVRFQVKMQVILMDSLTKNGDSWNPLYRQVENAALFSISLLSGNLQQEQSFPHPPRRYPWPP